MAGELDRLLTEAAEKIRQEAYAAGWRDALVAISRAMDEVKPPVELPDFVGEPRKNDEGNGKPSGNSGNAPMVGTTPHYVLQAVRTKPGMTGADVVLAVQSGGHSVPEPQIRTALSRLASRKLIVNRHKKWFPI